MATKKKIDGGYLAYPHRLLKRATMLKLSGSRRRALDCAVYQAIGKEENFRKNSFHLGLGVLRKYGKMTISEASRARDYLIAAGFLIELKKEDIRHRKAAEYRLNLSEPENQTVANLQRFEEAAAASNSCKNAMGGTCENAMVELQNCNCNSCENAILNNLFNNSPGFKPSNENNTPLPSPQGGSPRSDGKAVASESAAFATPLLPGVIDTVIRNFESRVRVKIRVTKKQRRELESLMAGCTNRDSFWSSYLRRIEECTESISEPDPRDLMMTIARIAALEAGYREW